MKFTEAKIGMRVGLCRAAFAKIGYKKQSIDYFDKKYSFGRIARIYAHSSQYGEIAVSSNKPTGSTFLFSPDVLVIDE